MGIQFWLVLPVQAKSFYATCHQSWAIGRLSIFSRRCCIESCNLGNAFLTTSRKWCSRRVECWFTRVVCRYSWTTRPITSSWYSILAISSISGLPKKKMTSTRRSPCVANNLKISLQTSIWDSSKISPSCLPSKSTRTPKICWLTVPYLSAITVSCRSGRKRHSSQLPKRSRQTTYQLWVYCTTNLVHWSRNTPSTVHPWRYLRDLFILPTKWTWRLVWGWQWSLSYTDKCTIGLQSHAKRLESGTVRQRSWEMK